MKGHGEKMHELMGMMSLFVKSLVRLFQLYEYCGISGIFLRQLETFVLAVSFNYTVPLHLLLA